MGDKMRFIDKLFRMFWDKVIGPKDAKRMSKQTLPEGIVEIRDIPYIDDGERGHLLDFYYPEKMAVKKLPVIIDFHGGGLMYAYKELNKNYCFNLVKRGFVVVNVNYRLAPEDRYPASVQDCMFALKWLEEHIAEYEFCDAKNIFVTGDSAGGFLTAITTAINSDPKLQEVYKVPHNNLNIRALGLTSGMFELGRSLAKVQCPAIFGAGGYKKSPYKPYADFDIIMQTAKLPPCFLVTSAEDMIQGSTLYFDKLLSQKGIRHKLLNFGKVEGRKLEHVFSVLYPKEYPESVETIDSMVTFFRKYSI